MIRFTIERAPAPAMPVEAMLRRVETVFEYGVDDYTRRVWTYLDFARGCGLGAQEIVDSCIDLAETLTDMPELVASRQAKTAAWQARRQQALAEHRPPRIIDMELNPVYFEAILAGVKTYEGRAYKPDSDKDYPDIRHGDVVRFQLSRRSEAFEADAQRRGLSPSASMLCQVDDVVFAPTVHGVYESTAFDGDAYTFQPMVNGTSEAIQVQRAAVYHTFPGYHELVQRHGFLGIRVESPQLIV